MQVIHLTNDGEYILNVENSALKQNLENGPKNIVMDFTEEDIQMRNKHIKFALIKKIEIKNTMW